MIQLHHFKTDMKSNNGFNVFNVSILGGNNTGIQYLYVHEKTNV